MSDSQKLRKTLTVTKLKKKLLPQEILLFLTYSLHTYNIIKEKQGQVIAREFNFFFFFLHLLTLHLFGEKRRQYTHSETYENCVLGQPRMRYLSGWKTLNKKDFLLSCFLSLKQPQGLILCHSFSQ